MFLHLSVILSTGGCLPQCMLGYTPGQTPLLPSACWDTPPVQCMLGYTPPCPVHTGTDMATAANGTHPTGMHSCFGRIIWFGLVIYF